jgi:hypothetical protein
MASTRTYVSLVNDAITEAGEELATFNTGGSDFTNSTDSMMNKFKTWTSRAWRDVQQECFDWEFMSEQGLCNLDPGIMFYTNGCPATALSFLSAPAGVATPVNIRDQDGTIALSSVNVGNVVDLTGVSTLTKPFGYFSITGTSVSSPLSIALKPAAEYITSDPLGTSTTTISGAINFLGGSSYRIGIPTNSAGAPTIVATVGELLFCTDGTNLIIGTVTSVASAPASATISAATTTGTVTNIPIGSVFGPLVFFVHSWKSFNFDEETSVGDFQETIEEINPKSFRIIDYKAGNPNGEVPLTYVPWSTFRDMYDLSSAYPGIPRLISEDDTGRWRLYPHPYYTVSLKFDYVRRPQILTIYTDVPKGVDDNYLDIIMWRTLIYYGEYEEQPSIVSRARKRYFDLLSRLDQKNREKPHFKPKRLY